MNESVPPPLPPATPPPTTPGTQRPQPSTRGPGSDYNLVADKIGGVPNLRKKDNLYQAAAIGVFVIIGLIVGSFFAEWPQGALLGALAGLIAGTLISGAVLTVIGLCRKS